MATITHATGVDGSAIFTPVSAAVANIGTSTSLGWTIAWVLASNPAHDVDVGGMYGSGLTPFFAFLGLNATSFIALDDGTANASATTLNTTDWWYLVLTYPGGATGTSPVGVHVKDLTTAGNWTHTGVSAANYHVNGGGSTTNSWVLGCQTSASIDWGNDQLTLGLCAAWGTAALSNAQIETLSPNAASTSKTSDAWNNAAGKPDLLIECTSTGYKTDIGNHVSTYSSDANWTLTGPDPTGWTFDGHGGVVVAPPTGPPLSLGNYYYQQNR